MATASSGVVLVVLCFVTLLGASHGYKHLILMHGMMSSGGEFNNFIKMLQETHPGSTYTVIDVFEYTKSLITMWLQTYVVGQKMQAIMDQHPEGVHLLCYSQGGLLCRSIIQTLPRHNVHNFISLSAPQAGQYGDTDYLRFLFPNYVKENIYKFFYTWKGQLVSVGNYWYDPFHQPLYRKYSLFLAGLNNQTIHSTQSDEYRQNFIRLKNLILIGGPDDGVITPWQSSHFGTFDTNGSVVDMQKQEWYVKDSFGLRTLHWFGCVHTYVKPGVKHADWPDNQEVYTNFIEQWLT